MKTWLPFLIFWLASLSSSGQSKRPVLMGIDVAKPLLSLVTPSRPAFRLAEITLKVPIPEGRYLSVVAGYGRMRSDTIFRNVIMDLRGVYLKAGIERFQSDGLVTGWHGLVALSHEWASYSFRGPAFGDYRATAFDRRRVAVGLEGFVGYQRSLSNRLLFRVSGRATAAGLLGPNASNVPVVFVPGVGLSAGNAVTFGVGLGVHLFYRTNPRPTVVSQP